MLLTALECRVRSRIVFMVIGRRMLILVVDTRLGLRRGSRLLLDPPFLDRSDVYYHPRYVHCLALVRCSRQTSKRGT
jgi:hypothetical protein